MRVTLLNQFYRPDVAPTAQLCASLADDRAARGDAVTVITGGSNYVRASKAGDDAQIFDPQVVETAKPNVIRIWTPGLGKKSIVKRLLDYLSFYVGAFLRLLILQRQDVIIAMTTPPFIVLAALAHRLLHRKTKLVLWSMDCYPDAAERGGFLTQGSFISRMLRYTNRVIFKRIDHLVCLDSAMVTLLMNQYVTAAKVLPVSIIPNWEDHAMFPRDVETEKWNKAASLGIADKFNLLYLGNTGVGHTFDTLIATMKRLTDEPCALLIVGGGSRLESIKDAVATDKVGNILFHEYVSKEQTPAVMNSASCAVITLRNEALGVMSPSKLHANLAMGLPILYIGPAGSNVDEAIGKFDCGGSFRDGDVEGATSFISSLVKDKVRYAQLRQNARHAFETAYSDAATLPQFHEIIESFNPQLPARTSI